MKRYAITPILPTDGITGYRSSAFDVVGTSVVNVIPVDLQTGIPIYNFTFARIGRVDFGPIYLLTNTFIFPDYPLDGEMAGMEASVRNALKADVEAYDLDGNGLHLSVDLTDLTVSYESVLFSIYNQFDPLLTLSNFRRMDVAEGNL